MEILFTKMHGLGNDFVLIDALQQKIFLDKEQIVRIADRRYGVGCDQILIIEPAVSQEADIFYRIYNADGGEVAQCGNGVRCVAAYLHHHNIINKNEIVAETKNSMIRIHYEQDDRITVDMGTPILEPGDIPVTATERSAKYTLSIDGGELEVAALSMGNPHAVLRVDDVASAPVETLGPEIQGNSFFPEGVNVGFMQVIDRSRIRLRVYERGAGETLACGSSACAAVVAGYLERLLDNEVQVELQGGNLSIFWQGEGEPVLMTGPATFVFEGRIVI